MVFEKIKSLLAEQLCIEESDIKEDSDLVADLGADSLDMVQLLIAMEKEFGTTFSDDDLKNVKTVQDVIDFVEKK
ncbi:acyl carrier protein [bacterium]|nr:acyl carrier protein [bacterium]